MLKEIFINRHLVRISAAFHPLSRQVNAYQSCPHEPLQRRNQSKKVGGNSRYTQDWHDTRRSYKDFTKYGVWTLSLLFSLFTSFVICEKLIPAEESKSEESQSGSKPKTKDPTHKSSSDFSKDSTKAEDTEQDEDDEANTQEGEEEPNQGDEVHPEEKDPPEHSPRSKERTSPFSNKSSVVTLKYAQEISRSWLNLKMSELGIPGISVAVSIDGKVVWAEGLGFADIENRVNCNVQTVMRIASISKPLTAVAASKLCEEGKLDLDAPIQKYVPDFPIKKFDNKEVTITPRQILSHTSGIRHYALKDENSGNEAEEKELVERAAIDPQDESCYARKRRAIHDVLADLAYPANKKKVKKPVEEFDLEEYYIKEKFPSVKQALELFKDDDLLFEPGRGFRYTTHGFTLLSAVIEGASGQSFSQVMRKLLHDLGLSQTYLEDDDSSIIYNRARYYVRDKGGILKNAPYVDNSYKLAGGGILSCAIDLTKFGNIMLHSFQYQKENLQHNPGFLKSSSVSEMWTPAQEAYFKNSLDETRYGLGWEVLPPSKEKRAFCRKRSFMAGHSGAAVGASSYLLILPTDLKGCQREAKLPQGVVVSLICNIQGAKLSDVGKAIAQIFEKVEDQSKVLGSISGSQAKIYNVCHL